MKVDGRHFRSIWLDQDGWSVGAIDQRKLPHEFIVARLTTCAEASAPDGSACVGAGEEADKGTGCWTVMGGAN